MKNGKAIILSAPSGAGKTTIVKHLISEFPNLSFSISATTRSPRKYEIDNKDYYFLSEEEFKDHISKGQFLEYEEVYSGVLYGTLKSELDRIWADNHHVVFDVDVEGGLNLKQHLGEKALSIFVKVKDLDTLRARLKNRNSESSESLERRVQKAHSEMQYESKFDYVLLNDDREAAFKMAENRVKEFLQD